MQQFLYLMKEVQSVRRFRQYMDQYQVGLRQLSSLLQLLSYCGSLQHPKILTDHLSEVFQVAHKSYLSLIHI